MLRPLRLIPSGVQAIRRDEDRDVLCQGYHRETIATSNDAFAYSSTMALHIFRLKASRRAKAPQIGR